MIIYQISLKILINWILLLIIKNLYNLINLKITIKMLLKIYNNCIGNIKISIVEI
jgi:hypothetical protein